MASKSLGTLTLDLVAKVGSFEAGMDKAARKAKRSGKEMEDSAAKAAKAWKTLGGVLGTIGAGGALLKVVDNTKQLEMQQAQLAAVLRSTGEAAGYSREQLNAMAAAMSGASMFSTGDFAEAQTTLLAFTGIVGDQFPVALQAAADMAARTGMTVKAAAETIGRALDVPSKGLGSLSDQGFRFTEEQKDLAKQLESTGRTAEAQAIILDALQGSYAGAAQAARDTFSGALTALQNTLGDLAAGGDGSLDSATAAINGLNDALASPAALVAVELLTDAAKVLAAVIAGRLVGSAAASAVAFASAQIQAARYQAALAGMAGVSKAAAVGIGAVSVAARASSAAFALVGGPFGAAALAAIAIGSFALSGREAKQPTDDLARSVRELSAAQREVAAIEAAKKIDELSAAAANLAANLAYAEENAQGTGKRSKRFADDAAYMRVELEKTGAELKKYQKRLDDIQNFKPGTTPPATGSAPADKGAQRSEKARLEGIAREIESLERAAKVWGMTADKVALYDLATQGATEAQLAQAEAALKTVAAFEERKEQQEAYKDLLADLRTEEERLTDQMRERLAVLDAMQGIEPDERMKVAGRIAGAATSDAPEFGGLDASVGGPFGELLKIDEAEEKLQEWYDTQLEMLEQFRQDRADLSAVWDEEELALKQQHEDELARIEQARQMAQLASAESIFGDLAGLTKTFAGEQSGLYKAMFAVQKAAAIAQSAVAIQQGIAMAAANPWPANLAAMASVAAATASIVSNIGAIGMAHDGIDSVPQTGTWLLEKGERVTTAGTSAKLDRTLDEIKGRGAGGGGITIHAPVTVEGQAGMSEAEARQQGQITADAINAVVMTRIEKESRPGGLLWNMYGGGR